MLILVCSMISDVYLLERSILIFLYPMGDKNEIHTTYETLRTSLMVDIIRA